MVRVCANCHTLSPHSIHRDSQVEKQLQHDVQMMWEIKNHKGHEDFIKKFGKGYIYE